MVIAAPLGASAPCVTLTAVTTPAAGAVERSRAACVLQVVEALLARSA